MDPDAKLGTAKDLPALKLPETPAGGAEDLPGIPGVPPGVILKAAPTIPGIPVDAMKDLPALASPDVPVGAVKDLPALATGALTGAAKGLPALATGALGGAAKGLPALATSALGGAVKDLPPLMNLGSLGGALADLPMLPTLGALTGDLSLFRFSVPGAEGLKVVRIFGREGLSSLFEFRVELAGPELALGDLVDRPALLQIDGMQGPRQVHGMIEEIEYVGQTSALHLYEATLVPWIWRLQHRQSCRIFQDLTTPQILEQVLTSAGLAKDWLRVDLTASYAPRNYCVQYRESDLAFVCRLMEEDGIFYFFEHAGDKHILVLGDHGGAHRSIPGVPVLWFKPFAGEMVSDQEHVQQFRFSERVRPGQVVLRDFNLHEPGLTMEVKESAKLRKELEVYNYPGEYQDPALGGPHTGGGLARLRLEGLQTPRRVGSGTSDCPRLTVGHTFSLVGHPRHEFDATYRILHVTHSGSQPQVLGKDASGDSSYANEFGVSELKAPYRPPLQTPRPVMRGLQTATVVGPPEEDVYTDEHGRVKVKFHWDRSESFDETSSCWVRVSQVWAGNGWGAMFLPRIGHEVLVDFIEGDPDRPVVVGRVYTGTNMPPYPLPDKMTCSTIKSESSVGGGGSNELRFEDRKGAEEVYLHAQKDWNTDIGNNLGETVKASRTSTIGGSETISVGGSRNVSVSGSDSTSVGAVHSTTISQAKPAPGVGPTSYTMSDTLYTVTSGQATITLAGPDVFIEAKGSIVLDAANIQIAARGGGQVVISGGPMVHINPPAKPPPVVVAAAAAAEAAAAEEADGAAAGALGGGGGAW